MGTDRFQGKTVWITGAETPVGQEAARQFYAEGANLVLSGISECPAGIKRMEGQTVACYPFQPTTEEHAEAALALAPNLDVTVAGTRQIVKTSILECSVEQFDQAMEENLAAAWCAVRSTARKIGKTRGGAVLILSSIHGEKPTGSAFLFSVANGGLNMLTREAALDLGRLGIRVNMLRYGPIGGDDAMLQSEISGIYHDMEKRIPRGTPGSPEEVAQAALFLCSEQASLINGSILTADGGFTGYYMDGDSEKRWDNGFLKGGGENS